MCGWIALHRLSRAIPNEEHGTEVRGDKVKSALVEPEAIQDDLLIEHRALEFLQANLPVAVDVYVVAVEDLVHLVPQLLLAARHASVGPVVHPEEVEELGLVDRAVVVEVVGLEAHLDPLLGVAFLQHGQADHELVEAHVPVPRRVEGLEDHVGLVPAHLPDQAQALDELLLRQRAVQASGVLRVVLLELVEVALVEAGLADQLADVHVASAPLLVAAAVVAVVLERPVLELRQGVDLELAVADALERLVQEVLRVDRDLGVVPVGVAQQHGLRVLELHERHQLLQLHVVRREQHLVVARLGDALDLDLARGVRVHGVHPAPRALLPVRGGPLALDLALPLDHLLLVLGVHAVEVADGLGDEVADGLARGRLRLRVHLLDLGHHVADDLLERDGVLAQLGPGDDLVVGLVGAHEQEHHRLELFEQVEVEVVDQAVVGVADGQQVVERGDDVLGELEVERGLVVVVHLREHRIARLEEGQAVGERLDQAHLRDQQPHLLRLHHGAELDHLHRLPPAELVVDHQVHHGWDEVRRDDVVRAAPLRREHAQQLARAQAHVEVLGLRGARDELVDVDEQPVANELLDAHGVELDHVGQAPHQHELQRAQRVHLLLADDAHLDVAARFSGRALELHRHVGELAHQVLDDLLVHHVARHEVGQDAPRVEQRLRVVDLVDDPHEPLQARADGPVVGRVLLDVVRVPGEHGQGPRHRPEDVDGRRLRDHLQQLRVHALLDQPVARLVVVRGDLAQGQHALHLDLGCARELDEQRHRAPRSGLEHLPLVHHLVRVDGRVLRRVRDARPVGVVGQHARGVVLQLRPGDVAEEERDARDEHHLLDAAEDLDDEVAVLESLLRRDEDVDD
mmetsp:Transcript_38232/g.73530  ORF Transcript_38232/g.73530 Transcript_38232/m.73530 type:complete len:857 (+) Transcript_38232:85-2655(+)